MKIDELKSNLGQPARPNKFYVNFFGPEGLTLEGMRCDTAVLPGRNIVSQDFSEYGPFRKIPYLIDYDGGQVQFSFYCDQSFIDRAIIEAWQQTVFDGEFNFGYYNDYIGKVEIIQMDNAGGDAVKFTLEEAYPLMIQNQQLDMASTDTIMKFQCSFAYRYWESEYIYQPAEGLGGLNKGRAALDAARTLLRLGARNSKKAARMLGRLESTVGKVERISNKANRINDVLSSLSGGGT